MRGFAAAGMFQPDYFLVLDRLYDTLEDRIAKWRKQSIWLKSILSVNNIKNGKKKNLSEERLVVACDLMAAIKYLHDNK